MNAHSRLAKNSSAASLVVFLGTLFAISLLMAPSAGAELIKTPPQQLVFVPGLTTAMPTAGVDVSCQTETANAKLSNPTDDFIFGITIEVDGVVIESGTVAPNQQFAKTFDIAENETKSVVIANGNTTYLDKDITRNCLLPEPSYQVLMSCATGQAHARLINNGDDTAYMAVDYPGDANALQAVGANSSIDWLLEVTPNTSVDFSVRDSGGVIGNESLAFSCAPPAPAPEPQPAPEPEPAPDPEPAPGPQPAPEPQPAPAEDVEPAAILEDDQNEDPNSKTTPTTVPPSSDSAFNGDSGIADEADAMAENAGGDSVSFGENAGGSADGSSFQFVGTDADDGSLAAVDVGESGVGTKLALVIGFGLILAIATVAVILSTRRRSATSW